MISKYKKQGLQIEGGRKMEKLQSKWARKIAVIRECFFIKAFKAQTIQLRYSSWTSITFDLQLKLWSRSPSTLWLRLGFLDVSWWTKEWISGFLFQTKIKWKCVTNVIKLSLSLSYWCKLSIRWFFTSIFWHL